MTRAQALAWLKAEFTEACTDLGWTFTDTADEGRFSSVLDNALRALSVPESGLGTYDVPSGQVSDFLLLLNYYALAGITRALALRVDIQVEGDAAAQAKRSQAAAAYGKLLAVAKADVQDLLHPGMEYGSLALDIYEPTPAY